MGNTVPIHAPDCSQKYDQCTCNMCGHFPCWHRLDDSLNISPTDPDAKFCCLGEDFKGCEQECPAFIGVLSVKDIPDEETDITTKGGLSIG